MAAATTTRVGSAAYWRHFERALVDRKKKRFIAGAGDRKNEGRRQDQSLIVVFTRRFAIFVRKIGNFQLLPISAILFCRAEAAGNMSFLSRESITEQIRSEKVRRSLKWSEVAREIGRSKEWTAAACLGQASASGGGGRRAACELRAARFSPFARF